MLKRTMLHILAISSDSLVDIIIFIPLLAVFPTIVDALIIKLRDRLNDWEKKRCNPKTSPIIDTQTRLQQSQRCAITRPLFSPTLLLTTADTFLSTFLTGKN